MSKDSAPGDWRRARPLDPGRAARLLRGIEESERFFMREDRVYQAFRKVTRLLNEAQIPYAVVGAMALNEYGYRRVTTDVDVLLTRQGLEAFKERYLGRGYVEKFPGSKGLRDAEIGVSIDVIIAGE